MKKFVTGVIWTLGMEGAVLLAALQPDMAGNVALFVLFVNIGALLFIA